MKKFIFLSLFLTTPLHARQIVLDIPDSDLKVVENDVVDAAQWIRDAWNGKLNKCKERLIKNELDRSIKESGSSGSGPLVPLTETSIIQKAFSRSDYKSRKEREAAAKADAISAASLRNK